MKKLYSALCILAYLCIQLGCGPSGEATLMIKIATQSPLSGGQAAFGEQLKLATQLAIEEVAEDFKKMGFTLSLAAFDDQADPQTGVANANEIVNDPIILGVIGHFNSGVTILSSDVYDRVGLVSITPASTSPQVTDRKLTSVNRVCGRDDVQGPAGASFAVKDLKAKKIFVLNDNTPYGQGLAQAFRDSAIKMGAQIPDRAFIATEERFNFIPILTQVQSFKPDLIYFGGTYDQIAIFTKQLREKNMTIPLLGGDGLESSNYIKLVGAFNATNTYYTTVAGPVSAFPTATTLVTAFKKKFNKDLEGFGIYSYDCAKILINAIKTTIKDGKIPTRDAVAKAVRAEKMEGITGKIEFDYKGDRAIADYFVMKYAGTELLSDNQLLLRIPVEAPRMP